MSADWDIAQTIHGPRRVVASPKPIQILELDVIRKLVELQAVVICGGGGGVPVIDRDGHHVGVPAVIDKDLLSSRLAIDLKADALIISTDADAVYSGFGTPDAKAIRHLSVLEAGAMNDAGAFPLPIEVTPFSSGSTLKAIQSVLNCKASVRQGSDGNLVTDNGNYIVDAQTGPTISNPSQTEAELLHIAGVVQVGLFTNMCDVVILAGADGVSVLEKEDTS